MTKYRINPGEFRHIITFQKETNIENAYGETDNIWEDVLQTRGGIYPISGKEFYAAERVNSELSHKVNMRYVPNITPDLRINFEGRIFQIISVINFQERNVELQLLCKEVV
jgi:SPP1 family predicted phage head-tail adaptor